MSNSLPAFVALPARQHHCRTLSCPSIGTRGELSAACGVEPGQRWLDLRAPETLQTLRTELATVLVALGLPDLDVSAARGPSRALTRQVARWAFERDLQGIAYRSRFADDVDCWAIFEGARLTVVGSPEPIAWDDFDMAAAAKLFSLTIEQ